MVLVDNTMKKLLTFFAVLAMFCAVGCEDKIQETPNENEGNESVEPEPDLPDVPPIENICDAMNDVEFIKFCTENFDTNKDGILTASEIVNVRHIDISNKKIYSIEGIAYFENLNELNARGSSLIEVDLSLNTKLSMASFRECALLENAKLPDLSKIADSTFYACNRLAQCKVPSSVTQIGNGAFQGCSAMTELSLSENVSSIGEYAFEGCSGLATISMYTTNIAEEAFMGVSGVLTIAPNTKLNKTDIAAKAFANSSIQSAVIGVGITEIGSNAFYNCANLTSATIPDGVIKVGAYAFNHCSSLESVIIPNSVTKIGERAFSYCSTLTEVYCKAIVPPMLGDDVFYHNSTNRIVYVPQDSIEDYCATINWRRYLTQISKENLEVGDLVDYGGARGVVFYIDNEIVKIVSILGTSLAWGVYDVATNAISETDAMVNMAIIKNLDTDLRNYPAFYWCANYGEGWYLPVQSELRMICEVQPTINDTLSPNGYTVLGSGMHWSSTEIHGSSALGIKFPYKDTNYYDHKNESNSVRAVITFSI